MIHHKNFCKQRAKTLQICLATYKNMQKFRPLSTRPFLENKDKVEGSTMKNTEGTGEKPEKFSEYLIRYTWGFQAKTKSYCFIVFVPVVTLRNELNLNIWCKLNIKQWYV